jgi:hypothetical protein
MGENSCTVVNGTFTSGGFSITKANDVQDQLYLNSPGA